MHFPARISDAFEAFFAFSFRLGGVFNRRTKLFARGREMERGKTREGNGASFHFPEMDRQFELRGYRATSLHEIFSIPLLTPH